MKEIISARWDGKVLIPLEAVDWPVGVPFEVNIFRKGELGLSAEPRDPGSPRESEGNDSDDIPPDR